jgi:hypothetical protein
MGAKNRGGRSDEDPLSSSSSTAAADGRNFRAAMLAGVSLIALTALGAPDAARACSGADQTISTGVLGPIFSAGGSITVLSKGTVIGGPTGVNASSCSVSTLTNSGAISGGASTGHGGGGVLNSNTIATLSNGGTISGGQGGRAPKAARACSITARSRL